jgi:hypothetical protein
VRDAASQLHLLECRKYNAEFERRLALEKQLAQVTTERDEAQQQQQAEQLQSLSIFNGLRAELETVKAERDSLQRQRDDLEKSFVQSMQPTMASVVQLVEAAKATAVEVTKKLGELPDEEDEPFPDPYQWQVGDVVESDGESPRLVITRDAMGWVFFKESAFGLPQFEWEKLGWGLHRKAADLPDIQPFTPQQVAEFAAVTKPIDDSVGTDGEGQS